jgi:hypothetical protein
LRAIGLALEALRAVDRYGVTRNNEQYKGWAQIEAPADTPTAEAAARTVEKRSGISHLGILKSPEIFRAAYRQAAVRVHPDQPGGSHDLFVELSRAKEVLEKHHGV